MRSGADAPLGAHAAHWRPRGGGYHRAERRPVAGRHQAVGEAGRRLAGLSGPRWGRPPPLPVLTGDDGSSRPMLFPCLALPCGSGVLDTPRIDPALISRSVVAVRACVNNPHLRAAGRRWNPAPGAFTVGTERGPEHTPTATRARAAPPRAHTRSTVSHRHSYAHADAAATRRRDHI